MITQLIVNNKEKLSKLRLCVLGKPGSGKGTISNIIANVLPCYVNYYNVGGILRERAKMGDDHIKTVHAAGGLVSVDKVLGIFDEALKHNCFILDGSPRRPQEASYIIEHKSWQENPGFLIHLDISDELAKQRLLDRNRFDDLPDVIQNRLNAFREHTEESISMMKDYCVRIDANQEPIKVVDDILSEIVVRL